MLSMTKFTVLTMVKTYDFADFPLKKTGSENIIDIGHYSMETLYIEYIPKYLIGPNGLM